jgi:hypothetical protein
VAVAVAVTGWMGKALVVVSVAALLREELVHQVLLR